MSESTQRINGHRNGLCARCTEKERALPPEKIRELFYIDQSTGVPLLRWRDRQISSVPAGSIAGGVNFQGYRKVSIFGVKYSAHRLLWAHTYGRWPVGQIDHIDGNRQNNRLSNLREVSHLTNQRNKKRARNSTTGVPGVSWHIRRKSYQVRITINYRSEHLGYFNELVDAVAARYRAERRHGFHINHGRAI